ncbi:MAG: sugar transferase [Gemmatimonadaceae bacterium]
MGNVVRPRPDGPAGAGPHRTTRLGRYESEIPLGGSHEIEWQPERDIIRDGTDKESALEVARAVETILEAMPDIQPRARSEVVNRFVNVVLAAAAMIVLAPVYLLIGLLVKFTSPGPIIYAQARVGIDRRRRRAEALFERRGPDLGGQSFTMYKFRSMRVDAERETGAVWASPNDARLTPIGGALRKYRLDELPQLYNVLVGDMNIVGPRPERPSIFMRLRKDISGYPLRQRAKPGLTGWAQINNAYDASLEDVRSKVRYDLEYLQRQSLAVDLRIMLKTVPVVLFRKGAW